MPLTELHCKKCVNTPIKARGFCRNHYEQWYVKNNPAYAAKKKSYQAKYQNKNRSKLLVYYKKRSAIKQADPVYREKRKAAYLMRAYGITPKQKNKLFLRGCDICGDKQNLRVDHNHSNGKVRGVLCHPCNIHLGWFEKVGWRNRALTYLKNPPGFA